ncbi:glutamate--tRNA ligase [Nitratifractor sp.]
MLRFQPSTAGDLRLDELRIALFSYILSRQRGGGFLLRIDDLGPRAGDAGGEEIRQLLEAFALPPEQTLHRSERLGRYQQLALRLVEEKKAFLCICSAEDLERERARAEAEGRPYRYSGHCLDLDAAELARIREEKIPFTIRIRKPHEAILYRDLLRGERRAEPGEVDHFVILRADGTPAEEFATACDDMLDGISLVPEEERSSPAIARRIHILHSLGYDRAPRSALLPPLLDEAGRRISAHHGAPTVRKLLEEGFLPDALLNYLLTLGIETPTEIFTLPEAVEWFDLERISPEAPRFELETLRRFNREHLRRMEERKLSRLFGFADAEVGGLAKLFLNEEPTLEGLRRKIAAIFAPKACAGETGEKLRLLSRLIVDGPYFRDYRELEEYLAKRSGMDAEALHPLLRRLMTGSDRGPDPEALYPYLKSYITEVARCLP